MLGVPQRHEQRILETESQDVLGGFLGQEMVDTEQLILLEDFSSHSHQLFSRGQIVPERLLDQQPGGRPAVLAAAIQPLLAHMPDHRGINLRRNRQVVEAVHADAFFGLDIVQGLQQCGIGRTIVGVHLHQPGVVVHCL